MRLSADCRGLSGTVGDCRRLAGLSADCRGLLRTVGNCRRTFGDCRRTGWTVGGLSGTVGGLSADCQQTARYCRGLHASADCRGLSADGRRSVDAVE